MQGVQPFLCLCVGRSSQLQVSAEQKRIDAKDNGCYQGVVMILYYDVWIVKINEYILYCLQFALSLLQSFIL